MATTCTIVSDKIVQSLLINLKRAQIEWIRDEIAASLEAFSTTQEREYQPVSSTVTRPDGRSILFRPFTSQNGPGVKIVVDPTTPVALTNERTDSHGQPATLHGVLVVCDADGLPKGLLNSDEITAFRTSMSVIIPYSWRRRTARVVIYGAGKVALWHVRLMLALRGEEIEIISIVNRSATRAEKFVAQIREENERLWKTSTDFEIMSTTANDSSSRIEEALNRADVICCTTPSSEPLFSARCVVKAEKHGQFAKFISGIGSWQPSMLELDPELLGCAVRDRTGVVIADDRESAMQVSGEIVQSRLGAEQILEVGELVAARKPQDPGQNGPFRSSDYAHDDLEEGLVIYKSVGVSITDLAAANAVLSLAKRENQGLQIDDF